MRGFHPFPSYDVEAEDAIDSNAAEVERASRGEETR